MKKILIAIALVAATTIANAQFVVSLQLSGAYNSGTTENHSTFTGISRLTGADTTYNFGDTTTHIPSMDITGGFKFGYQFVRTQVGIAGYFGMNRVKGEETIREFFDAHPESIQARWNLNVEDCQSEYTEQRMHFTIAPYVRHELIQFGDVALFAELNGYFTKVLQPLRHDFLDWYNHEMHYTIDTSFRITNSSVSIGAKITPGMSWQLSKHCSLDLYLDILAIAYDNTKITDIVVDDLYDETASPRILARRTTTTTVTTTNKMGFNVKGSPLLNNKNWVRVGFNYTF
jgi:hypothetical protein